MLTKTHDLTTTIDELGLIKAQIAELEKTEKTLKARLDYLAPGAYEGDVFRLAIIESVRTSRDKVFKDKIEELIEQHVSRQFVTAHTNETPYRTHKVSARNGKVAS
jgi:hypothetical protein